jgi:hypothetical protein
VLLFHMRTVITYYGTKHVEKILGLRFEVWGLISAVAIYSGLVDN